MKALIIIKFLLIISIYTTFGQSSGKLILEKNKLIGDCSNKYFSGFEIELDSTYLTIDSLELMSQFPRVGKINFKNRIEIPTVYTLTDRAGYPQIMFSFKNIYLTFDNLKMGADFISFTINHDPEVPVTEKDIAIVKTAKSLLSEEKYWNKEDDRNCTDDLANKCYSLYCALRISSLEIEEKYNHRNAVLQKLRHLIKEKYPNRNWSHRLMDFNNMEETNYEDIVNILDRIEEDFKKELYGKKAR